MENYRGSIFLKSVATLLVFTTVSFTMPVYATPDPGVLPTNYIPGAGNSSYSVDGNVGTLISSGGPTTGSHENFNIGSAATFNAFIDTAHLNKVRSGNPSEIFGAMNVHGGKLFLVNTGGIYFAPGSQVNASGLVASSLDINNQDFLNGQHYFFQNGNAASVINAGTMNIGSGGLALIGGAAANQGFIEANEGSVVLAGGKEMTLSFDDSGLISVLVDKQVSEKVLDIHGNEIKDGAANSGILRANGGRVVMTAEAASGIFDNLVNQSGVVEANSVGTKNGQIILSSEISDGIVRNSGTLNAKGDDAGEKGGKIQITGEKVGLFEGALVDASGFSGGGTVLIGGDYQGLGSARNATATYVDPLATVKAGAIFEGDGGKIIVWANDSTRAYGVFSARGGLSSGDGGLIETSGKNFLDVDGIGIDAGADHGLAGTWLLDPNNITISAGTTSGGAFSGANPNVFTATGTAVVKAADINTKLDAGTSVTITTGASANSDITLNSGVGTTIGKTSGAQTVTLTFTATRDIVLLGIILASSGIMNVVLNAGRNLTVSNNVSTNGGSLTATATSGDINLNNAASDIASAGGAASFTAGDEFNMSNAGSSLATANGNVDITAVDDVTLQTISSSNGHLFVTSTDGAMTLKNALNTTGVTGDIALNADDNITLNGASADVTATGGDFTANADGDTSSPGSFDQDNAGSAISTGGGAVSISGRDVSLTGTIHSGAGSLTFQATSGDLTVSNILSSSNSMTLTATDDVKLNNANSDITTGGGDFTVNADSDADNSGDFDMSHSGSSVNTGVGTVSATSAGVNLEGTLTTTGVVKLQTSTAGRTIGLGGGSGNYNLTSTEMDQVTAGSLEVGRSNSGNILINNISPANTGKLVLRTSGSVMEGSADAAADITVANLAIDSATGVNVDVDVTNLAVKNSSAGGIDVTDTAGGMTVNSITNSGTTINGVSTGSGDIALTATGSSFGLNADVATPGKVTLTAGSTINQTAGTIRVADLVFSAGAAVTLDQAANNFTTVTGTTAGGAISVADSATETQVKDLKTVGSSVTYAHTGVGDVTVTGTISSGNGATNGGNITLTASHFLTIAASGIVSTSVGAGGVLSGSGFTNNGTVTLGAGNISINASGLDTVINTPINQAVDIILTALRDIIIQTTLTASGTANINLTADSDTNGAGGIWLQSAGGINSAGNVTLTGSDIFATPEVDGIRIDADGANNQILAAGNINLVIAASAPAGANIIVNGKVTSTGSNKTITANAKGSITTSDNGVAEFIGDNLNLTAATGINVESDVKNASLANTTSGDVSLEDMSGGLTLTGYSNGGAGTLDLVSHSPLTIAAGIIQAATINLTAGESAGAGDDLTVNSGITVKATGAGSDVNLSAGDNVILNTTSVVKSDTDQVNITAGSADVDDIGSVNLAGTVSAATALTLTAVTQAGGALGSISQTNGSFSAADLILNTDGSATLNQAANNVATLSATAGGAVTYQDADGLDLKASTIVGALNVTTGGNLTDSGTLAVTGITTLTAGANDITLNEAANNFSTVSVVSAKNVTLKDINSLNLTAMTITGAFSATVDSDNNTAGSALTTGVVNAGSVSLIGGTDLNDVINLNGGIITNAGGITVQNAATVNVANALSFAATGGAISLLTDVAQILLNGTNGTTNTFTTNSNNLIDLAPVNATNDVNLTVNSNGDVTLGNLDINAGNLTVNVDNNDDGANTGTFGDITSNNLSISGHNTTSGNENFTSNGIINISGDLNMGGVGILAYNNDVTAKSITLHDISNRIQLGGNVDLTATNGVLSAFNSVNSILLAGANGTTNVFDGNGDAAVNLSAANGISATNSPALTVNSEGDITLGTVKIGTGVLTLAVDNDADTTNTGSFGALTAGTISAGGSSNDNLDFNAAVVANTAGVTITNANNVDFDSTINMATDLKQTTGSGATTFSNTATVGGNTDIATGAIAFNGAGNINSNSGAGAVKLTALTGGITSGTAAADVTAASLEVQSAGGIDLDTAISSLAFNNTSGAIDIRNIGALTIDNIGALAASSNTGTTTTLSATTAMTFAVDTASAGDLTATSGESVLAGDDLTVNAGATVKSAVGNMLLRAGDNIMLSGTSVVQSDAGSVTMTAGFADAGDTLGSVFLDGTTTAATSAVITALIASVNGSGLVTANTANIDAVTGIGNTTPLNAAASFISADSVNGNIDMNNAIATVVEATSLTTGNGSITFDQSGGGNLTVDKADITGDGEIVITVVGPASLLMIKEASTADGGMNFSSQFDLIIDNNALVAVGPNDPDADGPHGATLTADSENNGVGSLIIRNGAVVNGGNGPVVLRGANAVIGGTVLTNDNVSLTTPGQLSLGLISSSSFNLSVGGNVTDTNGDANNLVANQSSSINAGGTIGSLLDPIEIDIASGDLLATSNNSSDGVSINLRGPLSGDLVTNLTPGLVLFNDHPVAGTPLSVLESGTSQATNIISQDRGKNGIEDLQRSQNLQRGLGLVPGLEKPFVPTVDVESFFNKAPIVTVSQEFEKLWLPKVRPVAVVKPVVPTIVAPVVPIPVAEQPLVTPITVPTIKPLATPTQIPVEVIPTMASVRPQPAWVQQAQDWFRGNTQGRQTLQTLPMPPTGNRLFQRAVEQTQPTGNRLPKQSVEETAGAASAQS